MEQTPRSNRVHIGIFGRCNSGKSSLVNALTDRKAALVSDIAGTTADPVLTPMELSGIGPVVFLDTAGFDDSTPLGPARIAATRRATEKTDIAVIVCCAGEEYNAEAQWTTMFQSRSIPVIVVLNKVDKSTTPATISAIEQATGIRPISVSAATGNGIDNLLAALSAVGRKTQREIPITGNLAHAGDVVLLVMPQDAGAPTGRLILPQSQTIRELLDKGCTTVCCTPDGLDQTLHSLTSPPQLIVTDSQAFQEVVAKTPPESRLTSFSILFAHYKGDLRKFVEGAAAIDRLTARSQVLIAEACTHAPATEDIGRVKLPRLLRAWIGNDLHIDIVAGDDFPEDLSRYDLVIHCGGCMFNRRHLLSRIEHAASQGVPITNYGVALAHLAGILDRVALPESK